mgnify:CR=1 FL=1
MIYSDDAFNNNPIKIFKRILQLTDMIIPVLGEKEAKDIHEYVNNNLKNRDVQLLNEYMNLVDIMGRIFKTGKLYSSLKSEGKMQIMASTLESVINELKAGGNVHPEDMKVLEDYYNVDIKGQLNTLIRDDIATNQKEILDVKYHSIITPMISKIVLYTITDPDKIHTIINRLKNVYFDAGFHYIFLYPADRTTFYVEKDEYTQTVKDFKSMALENDLAPDMNYKVLPKEQIPKDLLKYRVWVRYNATKAQDEYYAKLKDILLKNKGKYILKQQRYFVK